MLVCGLTVAPSPPRLPLFRRGAVSYILIRSRTPVPLSPSLLLPSSLKPLGDPLRSTARPPGGVMWCDVFLTACLMEPWWSGRPFWSASAGARRPTLPLWLSPCSLAAPRLASGCPSLLRASIFYSLNEVRPPGVGTLCLPASPRHVFPSQTISIGAPGKSCLCLVTWECALFSVPQSKQ